MEIPKLEEIAAFAVAKHLWHGSGAYKEFLNFVSRYSFQKLYLNKKIESVKRDLVRSWPNLPGIFVNIINSAIECVGEEIFAWIEEEYHRIQWRACEIKDVKYYFQNLNFYDICWSPFLTVDQMKSKCKTKEFNLRDGKLCDCCFEYSVNKAYPVVIPYLTWFRHIYGGYAQYALAFIVHCRHEYSRIKRHIFSIFLRDGSAVENIFKLSVLCAYDTGVRYYWSQLTEEQRKRNIPELIEICLNQWFVSESKLTFSKKESNTFCFLWSKLSYNDQMKIIETRCPWVLRSASLKMEVYQTYSDLFPHIIG